MFKVIIDSGKPFEVNVKTAIAVFKEIAKIPEEYKEETDVWIYDNTGKDITEQFIGCD